TRPGVCHTFWCALVTGFLLSTYRPCRTWDRSCRGSLTSGRRRPTDLGILCHSVNARRGDRSSSFRSHPATAFGTGTIGPGGLVTLSLGAVAQNSGGG